MSNFDDRLKTRIKRLDAAVPAPRPPAVEAADAGSLRASSRSGRRRRGRTVIVLLAAAALLLGTSVVAAQRFLYPEVPEPVLEAALAQLFGQSDCITETDAVGLIRGRLDALGYADWEIESRTGAAEARCVAPGLLTSQHVVMLFPAPGRDVLGALDGVADELMRDCVSRSEAIALVSSVLASLGVSDFSVRADPWGPQAAPLDQIEAYQSHVAAGCFVYAGIQNGRNVDLWGRWP